MSYNAMPRHLRTESAFRRDSYPVRFLIVDRDTGAVLGECQSAPRVDPASSKIVVPAKAVSL